MSKAMLMQKPGNNSFQRAAAKGHRERLGHELDSVLVSADGLFWTTVRFCCGDTLPDEVPTLAPMPETPSEQTVERITSLLFPSPKG